MRRLMFVTQTHTVWGGNEWWVHHLAAGMQTRGWRVYAALAQGARFSDPAAYAREHPHLEPVIIDARVGTESARVNAVRRALRRVKPDVVIPVAIGAVFDAIDAVDAALLAPVLSLHDGWLTNVVERRDTVDLAVANSRLLERLLIAELGAEKVRYVRQGVPHAAVPRSARTPQLRVGLVCRLENVSKRVLDLPRVADRVGSDVELHVFGDGPDRAALEAALGGRAVLHGYMPPEQLYREAYPNLDVLILFSPAEGSPNAVYEAMKNGVIPVSSRFMGSASEGILRDRQNALLFDIGDTEAAARHLTALAADRETLEQMSGAAREAVAGYSDEDMYEAWAGVIESAPRHPVPRRRVSRSVTAGRLERIGIPAAAADVLRSLARVRFPHRTGWEEWPGSQPGDGDTAARLMREISDLERSAQRAL